MSATSSQDAAEEPASTASTAAANAAAAAAQPASMAGGVGASAAQVAVTSQALEWYWNARELQANYLARILGLQMNPGLSGVSKFINPIYKS